MAVSIEQQRKLAHIRSKLEIWRDVNYTHLMAHEKDNTDHVIDILKSMEFNMEVRSTPLPEEEKE